jgi:hypothetical protein
MLTIRNLGGVALFLFGTTFLWLTPSFATPGVSTKGLTWSVTQSLSLVTLALFAAATWGLFTKAGWWEPFIVDSAKIAAKLDVHATPTEHALAGTVASYRTNTN